MMIFKTNALTKVAASALLVIITLTSCDYLNVVPDNVSTVDKAFTLRNEAQKYLFTLYSFIPRNGDVDFNVGMLAGDEIRTPFGRRNGLYGEGIYIAEGLQTKSDPYVDAWTGQNGGAGPGNNFPLFQGIRQCNIFLENMRDRSNVRDITEAERERWIGEAMFLKAYFHYYLMRMYGPIPIIDENVSVDAPEEKVQQEREPVDEVVDFVVTKLDSATTKLPLIIQDKTTEYGRITKSIAKSVKSNVLLTAASPLFNGNTDLPNFTNKEGTPFINPNPDPEKWQRAADAALDAIQTAESAGHQLYEFPGSNFDLSDTTRTKLSIRQALSERGNPEVIWPLTNSAAGKWSLQIYAMSRLTYNGSGVPASGRNQSSRGTLSATLKTAKMFYTENGVPIEEDNSLDFSNFSEIITADTDDRYNLKEGYATARLNFNREPRFYADLAFDGSIFYKRDSPSQSDEDTYYVTSKYGDFAGAPSGAGFINDTGYFLKKLVHWQQTMSSNGANFRSYPWPQIRLAQLYLNYAEAENEANGPSSDVYEYLNRIRERAGLDGVVESWEDHSIRPQKPASKEGLREIIRQERKIELAFEGKRYWDLKRWKTANQRMNEAVQGWNIFGDDATSYYQVRTIISQSFIAPRDYFWPIRENTMIQNPALIQNPGW